MATILASSLRRNSTQHDYGPIPDIEIMNKNSSKIDLQSSLETVDNSSNLGDDLAENNTELDEEQNGLINLINWGYNSVKISDKSSDLRVFQTSKTKFLIKVFRLFLKIGCCILYVLQTLPWEMYDFPITAKPDFCFNVPYLLSFSEIPKPSFDISAYNCSSAYQYDLGLPPSNGESAKNYLASHVLTLKGKEASLLADKASCNVVCSRNRLNFTCSKLNDYYSFCNCILECEEKLICLSDVKKLIFESEDTKSSMSSNNVDYSKLFYYPKPLILYLIQAVFSISVVIESFLTIIYFYRQGVRLSKLIDIYVFIDWFNGILFIITLCYPPCLKNLFIPIFFQCLSAQIILNELIYEVDTYSVQTKWFNVLTQKLISLLFTICGTLFVSICIIHYLERTHDESDIHNLFDSLWFIIITITTVGYGDISPKTWFGRLYVMFLVLLVLFSLTTILEELLTLFGSSRKNTIGYFNYAANRHVVLCTSNLRMNFLVDYLNEFYSDPKNDVSTVILCPRSADKMTENRLKSPVWQRRVILLEGSALRHLDLDRAAVLKAKYCFIMSDRHTDDPQKTDQETILRAIAIKKFAPRVKLYVHILKPENRFHVDFATRVMCEGEIKHALLASNCICPGFSTFITLLLHTTSPDDKSPYSICSGNEIYDIKLKDSKRFSKYNGKDFLFAAVNEMLFNSQSLLIGVKSQHSKEIILNPGKKYILKEDDTCIYISQNAEEQNEQVRIFQGQDELENMCAKIALLSMDINFNLDETAQEISLTQNTDIAAPDIDNNDYMRCEQSPKQDLKHMENLADNLNTSKQQYSLFKPNLDVNDNSDEKSSYIPIAADNGYADAKLSLPEIVLEPLAVEENNTSRRASCPGYITHAHKLEIKYEQSAHPDIENNPGTANRYKRAQNNSAVKKLTSCKPKEVDPQKQIKLNFLKANLSGVPSEVNLKHKKVPLKIKPGLKNCNRISRRNVLEVSDLSDQVNDTQIGVPPFRPYIGMFNIKCHINIVQTKYCCLQIGWKIACDEERKNIKPTKIQNHPEDLQRSLFPCTHENAIIVAADDAGPQLYHFVLPLRSAYIPKEEVKPIVLILPFIPETPFLEAISWLPHVYFMIGSAELVEDLLIAGILKANGLVLCVGDGIHEEKDEIHMTDASRLNVALKLTKVFPNTPLYIELFHRANMRFLCSRQSKENTSKYHKNPNDFMRTTFFRSGQVFSPSMLDTMLYQSADKSWIIDLVRLMLGLEQVEGSAYLAKVCLTSEDVAKYQTYGMVMCQLSYNCEDLAIGIYRTEKGKIYNKKIQAQYNKVHEFLENKLKELKIENVEIPLLKEKSENKEVLVNPEAGTKLMENDIILVLRCNRYESTKHLSMDDLDLTNSSDDDSSTDTDTETNSDKSHSNRRLSVYNIKQMLNISNIRHSFSISREGTPTRSRGNSIEGRPNNDDLNAESRSHRTSSEGLLKMDAFRSSKNKIINQTAGEYTSNSSDYQNGLELRKSSLPMKIDTDKHLTLNSLNVGKISSSFDSVDKAIN